MRPAANLYRPLDILDEHRPDKQAVHADHRSAIDKFKSFAKGIDKIDALLQIHFVVAR